MKNTASKKLILISKSPDDASQAESLAKACSMKLEIWDKLDESRVRSEFAGGASVLVDSAWPGILDSFGVIVSSLSVAERARIHWIVASQDKPLLGQVYGAPFVKNVLYRKFRAGGLDTKSYARVINVAYSSNSFGLQSFLGDDARIDILKFNETLEKGFVANALGFQLKELGLNELIVPMICNAADELLMNAIYDAPVGLDGKRLRQQRFGGPSIQLTGKDAVEMEVSTSDDYVAVNVVDLYGSLDPRVIFQHIAKTFNGRQDEINEGASEGAGLGLSLIVKSGGSLLFTCKPGERTDAIVFFRRTETLREFTHQFQFVSARKLGSVFLSLGACSP